MDWAHDSSTSHDPEQNHHDPRKQAHNLADLADSDNGAREPVAILISGNGICAVIYEAS